MIGRRLGHYEVVERVGAGGMGEVYRARDSRLQRDVALKVIPPRLLGDEEHRARFEREARLLASLNHPHIAAIHGIEEHEGQTYLVLEFVTGADLAQRLSKGPMPTGEVLVIAGQVADALESAHRQGVIHRDLKPSNIALTADGAVKVLDFGLAKALDPTSGGGSASLSQSPTLLGGATASNIILGTAAYMSPEQARGAGVDARADVWAFGCVIFECLTGRRAFEGGSISDTLAAVLRDAIDWSALPADTPPALRRLLRRCLERDTDRRLHSLADAQIELADAEEELRTGVRDAVPAARRSPTSWLSWAIVAGLAVSIIVLMSRDQRPAPEARVVRFAIEAKGLDTSISPPVISPDGSRVVYSAEGHLWVRALDQLEPRALEGTEDARCAFWSPDGTSIGFQTRGRLWRVPVGGGRPVVICTTPMDFSEAGGAAWGDNGRIVFSTGDSGLYEVVVSHGVAVPLLEPEEERDDDFHSPSMLPDGTVIFVPHPLREGRDMIDVYRDGQRSTLWKFPESTIESPVYADGYLLFERARPDPGVWALAFSAADLDIHGDPFLVASEARQPSVSRDGVLVYTGGSSGDHYVIRLDHEGKVLGEPLDTDRHIDDVALSPSGERLLLCLVDGSHNTLVVQDLERGTRSVIASSTTAFNPFWIDDHRVGFVQADSMQIVSHDLELALTPHVMFRTKGRGVLQRAPTAPSLTADRARFLFVLQTTQTKGDIWIAAVDGSDDGVAVVATEAREDSPQPSPASNLLAYSSDESGRTEIYVAALQGDPPTIARRWQVSSEGGEHPRWSLEGDRLYYASEDQFMEVVVDTSSGVALGRPRTLYSLTARNLELMHGYSVDPRDGALLMIQAGRLDETQRRIVVVQNWLADSLPR